MHDIPYRKNGCCDLSDDGSQCCSHHSPLKGKNENGIENHVDNCARQSGEHGEFRIAVRTDDGIHGLPEHIKRNTNGNPEKILFRQRESFRIDAAAECCDDGVIENKITHRQNDAGYDTDQNRIADGFCGIIDFFLPKRDTDKCTGTVTDHNRDPQCNDSQRKDHCVGGIAIRAEIGCIGDEDLTSSEMMQGTAYFAISLPILSPARFCSFMIYLRKIQKRRRSCRTSP